MIIAIALGLGLAAGIGVWLKRRHQRKQDQIRGVFNAGITERAPPMSKNDGQNTHGAIAPTAEAAVSGSSSPARTREAFMPYGYAYSRSENHVGSQPMASDEHRSPLSRGGTTAEEMEKGSVRPASSGPGNKGKRAIVRERGVDDHGSWK